MTLTITSASFADGSSIPSAYTCEGDGVSPPLSWGGVPDDARSLLPIGTEEGLNDWRRAGYGGPCPAIGRHRYFHKLYALDAIVVGSGKQFLPGDVRLNLELLDERRFGSGVVYLRYRIRR